MLFAVCNSLQSGTSVAVASREVMTMRTLREDRRGVVWLEYLILIAVLALAAIGGIRQLGSSIDGSADEQGALLVAMSMSTPGQGGDGSPSIPDQPPPPQPPPEEKECSGWLSCAWDAVTDAAPAVLDFAWDYTKGVYGAVWDDLRGTWETIKDPSSIIDGVKYAIENPGDALRQLVWDDESAEAWANGDYGTSIGRTVWNVGSFFIPGAGQAKWLGKLNKLRKAAPDVPKNRLPDDAPDSDLPDGKPRDSRADDDQDADPDDDAPEDSCPIGGCSEPGKCFAAGTPVHTEHGLRAIEDVEEGDYIWSRDDHSGALALQRVEHKFITPEREIRALTLEHEELHVTPEHPFWTQQGWKSAKALHEGEYVELFPDEWTRVVANEPLPELVTVYNFEVEDFHTYFVGNEGVWVHNKYDEENPRNLNQQQRHRLRDIEERASTPGNDGTRFSVTRREHNQLRDAFLGEGYRVEQRGRSGEIWYISADGKRMVREPTNKSSDHARTGKQANYHQRENKNDDWFDGQKVSNVHVNIK
jgi:Flp pilus assembly pilin Flp